VTAYSLFSQLPSICEGRRLQNQRTLHFARFVVSGEKRKLQVCGFKRCEVSWRFVGAVEKLPETIISFVISVRLSVRSSVWKNSASTGRIVVEFLIVEKIQVWLKADNNIRHFT
jgi:hypothetical protein